MARKIISILLLLSLVPAPLLAQSTSTVSSSQAEQAKKYFQSAEGKQFLQSPTAQTMLKDYVKPADDQKKSRIIVEKELTGDEIGAEMAETKQVAPPSDLEAAFASDLLPDASGKKSPPVHQYGYDIFESRNFPFAPSPDGAPDPDYIIGVGDSFQITLWGITEGIFSVKVDGEGAIILPKVGKVKIAGLPYGQLTLFVKEQLGKYYESVNVGITVDKLRSIRVYVMGEVNHPGSYTVSSLSTVFNTLFDAGGPTKKGTLRNIQLIRNGKTIAQLDLYRFLLYGDKSHDSSLRSGDTIFVPIIGPVAAVAGAVYRPGIYEIKEKTDLKDLIYLAGGFLSTSYLSRVQVTRIIAHEKQIIRDENIPKGRAANSFGLNVQDRDMVEVVPIYAEIRNFVKLEGKIKYPGTYEFKEGMRIKDLLPNIEAFPFDAYLSYVEIIRTNPATRKVEICWTDLKKLYAGDDSQNIVLQPLDRIVVSSERRNEGQIYLMGEVLRSGAYTFSPGEKLSTILKRAGGFTTNAYLYGSKFVRQSAKNTQRSRLKDLVTDLQKKILEFSTRVSAGQLGENEQKEAEAQLERSEKLLQMVEEKLPEGRVILQLTGDIKQFEGSVYDIELEDRDVLYVPPISKVISIIGEIFTPSSTVYDEKASVKTYLRQVGGFTKGADRGGIYVIRADGSVVSSEQGVNVAAMRLMPGDTIIVPQVIDRVNVWASIKDWTHWLYEAALAYAALVASLR